MKPSPTCFEIIKKYERCVLHSYLDQRGKWTIGWGTTYYPNGAPVKKGQVIPQWKADELLAWQIDEKTKKINKFIPPVTQYQFDALVSFAYNEGAGALEGSTLLKRIKAHDTPENIRAAFLMWNKVRSKKTGRLVRSLDLELRRESEAHLFNTGEFKYFHV